MPPLSQKWLTIIVWSYAEARSRSCGGDGGKGVQDKLQEGARAALAQMLKEGQGDHILLLRLYQVRECVHVS